MKDSEDVVSVLVLVPMSDASKTKQEQCINNEVFFNDDGQSYPRCLVFNEEYQALAVHGLLAAKEFNDRSRRYIKEFGEVGNCTKTLSIKFCDSSSSPSTTTREVLDILLNEKHAPDVAVGAFSSAETVPITLILGAKNIPVVGYQATSLVLNQKQDFPYFMRTILPDDVVATMTCKLWKSLDYRFVGMMYLNDQYGNTYKESILKSCSAMNINVQTFPFPSDGGEESIKTQIQKLSDLNINVFLLVMLSGKFDVVMNMAYNAGLLQPGRQWYFGDGVDSIAFQTLRKEVADAVSGSFQILQVGGTLESHAYQQLQDDWVSFNISDFNPYFPRYWALSPSLFHSNSLFTKGVVRDAGSYLFDSIATVGLGICGVTPTEPLPSNFAGAFFERKGDINFNGLSGMVKFDTLGNREAETANLQIFNILAHNDDETAFHISTRHVGTLNKTSQRWEFHTKVFSNSNWTGPVVDVNPTIQNMHHPQFVKTIALGMFGIGIILDISIIAWLVLNRKNPIVRASQFCFLLLVAIGCGISLLAIVFMVKDDEGFEVDRYNFAEDVALHSVASLDFACNVSVALFSFGSVLCHATLATKAYMISLIFSRSSFRKVSLSVWSLYIGITALCAIDSFVLVLWLQNSPAVFTRNVEKRDLKGFALSSVGRCDFTGSAIFLVVLGIIHFVLLFVGAYFAYKSSSVHTAFAEGKSVGLSIALTLQLSMLAIPVNVIASKNQDTTLFFRCLMVFSSNFLTLLLVFAPKIKMSRSDIARTSLRSIVVGSLDKQKDGSNKLIQSDKVSEKSHAKIPTTATSTQTPRPSGHSVPLA